MDRMPRSRHALPEPDSVPPWARLVLYIVAILAPFAALIAGRLTGEQALAAVVGLFGVIGPAVAVVYNRKQADDTGAYYRAGYAEAVHTHVVGTPQAGTAAGDETTSENDGDRLEGPHNTRGTR